MYKDSSDMVSILVVRCIAMVKISVIVPVYNCEDYLEESIKSILNQSFKDIEIICVDDGSSDNSLNILKDLACEDSRLKVFSQENQGSSSVRNFGLKNASGDYLYFFDADDFLVEYALEEAYSNAINNGSDIVVFKFDQYKDNKFFKHSGQDIEKQFPDADFSNFTFNFHDYRERPFRGPFAPWFKLYKKEFLDRHDCFEFPNNLNHNDLPFHVMTFLKASKISFVPKYLYHYNISNPSSISNTRFKNYDHIFKVIQTVEDFLKSEGLFEEFKKEFDFLKVNGIAYEIRGRPNEYLLLAKEELSNVDLNNDLLPKNALFKARTILNSNSIEEYNYKIEIDKLKKENRKLSKSKKELKKQNNAIMNENKKLLKQNDEILNSNSWKLMEIFRKLRRLF